MKDKVQKFGRTLSAMVMPNIAVFIAWGIITALFIPAGFFPNETLATLVDPMNKILLPVLIGYTGGHNVYGQRGAIVGTIMTFGVVTGAPIPMFIGAMIAGPLGAWLIKKFDETFKDKIPSGFEMLVNNFSAGILGFILAIIGVYAINPVCIALTDVLTAGVDAIVNWGLLPLLAVLVEPAKILFLNNAINHAIFSPIGIQEVAEVGKSIFFLIEANPGPGLGILLAYMFVGKGSAKATAPGAAIIHFFGGIHEIYFPYILMKPVLILAVIAGGATGIFVNTIFNSGLVAPAAPGSIIAILSMTAPGSHVGVILSVVAATVVSMLIAMVLLKGSKDTGEDIEEAKQKVSDMKTTVKQELSGITKVVFACDAGMGSSAMGATILTKKFKDAGKDIEVHHYAINDIPDDVQVIVTHTSLVERVEGKFDGVTIFPITNFMGGDEYDKIVEAVK